MGPRLQAACVHGLQAALSLLMACASYALCTPCQTLTAVTRWFTQLHVAVTAALLQPDALQRFRTLPLLVGCSQVMSEVPELCRENQLMQHLAATLRMMLGDIDLTVSDRHCAFVLCQALQQLQRRRRVARCLLPPDKWQEQVWLP